MWSADCVAQHLGVFGQKGATSPWAVRPSVLRGFEGLPTTWVRPSLPPGTILVVGGEFPSGLGKRVLGYFGQTRKKKIKLYLAAPKSGATREGGLYSARGLVTRLRCVVCRTGRAVWGFDNEDLRLYLQNWPVTN